MWQGPTGISPRQELVINIQGAVAGNDIAPEAVYTPAHDDPMYEYSRPIGSRPFPELLPCDDGTNATLAALQAWQPPAEAGAPLADICSQDTTSPGFAQAPCFNVQRSEDRIILWPKQEQSNTEFALISFGGKGRIVSALNDGEAPPGETCVGATGVGQQLILFHNCSELRGGSALVEGFLFNTSSGQIQIPSASTTGMLCVTANHHGQPAKPHSGGGKFFGAIRSGKWKLIVGYPVRVQAKWSIC